MVDEADELYGLPDDEFTSARDALAKRLRGEKRREEADEVKALRRPSVAAGAINRAVREHGADELLDAGEALREAHEALLSGSGDAAGVREATAREREAVRDFAALALGDGASASTEEKVRATLHAASIDDDVRELLVAGRLERDAEAGADPMALLAAVALRRRLGGGSAVAVVRGGTAAGEGGWLRRLRSGQGGRLRRRLQGGRLRRRQVGRLGGRLRRRLRRPRRAARAGGRGRPRRNGGG